jgi:hypothetical protein
MKRSEKIVVYFAVLVAVLLPSFATAQYKNTFYDTSYAILSNDANTVRGNEVVITGAAYIPNTYKHEGYLLKVDAVGNAIWSRRYIHNQRGLRLFSVEDDSIQNHYILIGYLYDSLPARLFISIADTAGHELSAHFYTDSLGTEFYNSRNSTLITSAGNLLVGGYAGDPYERAFLMMCDPSGSILWSRIQQDTALQNADSEIRVIRETPGHQFMTLGSYHYSALGKQYMEITRFDSSGNMLWHRAFDNVTFRIQFQDMVIGSDESIYLSGYLQDKATGDDRRGYLVKIDSTGQILYTRQYSYFDECGFGEILLTDRNTLLISSTTLNFPGPTLWSLTELDTAGNLLSTNALNNEMTGYALSMDDGGFSYVGERHIVVGSRYEITFLRLDSTMAFPCPSTNLFLSQGTFNLNEDLFPITYSPITVFATADSTAENQAVQQRVDCSIVNIYENNTATAFTIYPNPFTDKINIRFLNETPSGAKLTIYNSVGSKIIDVKIDHEMVLSTESFANGIYFITVSTGNLQWSRKLLKSY